MRSWSRPLAGLSLLLAILGLAFGCRQEVPPLFRRNQLPETTLTIIPEDSTQGFYRYHIYWRGEDSDGRVVRYIFAITDTISRNEEENWDPNLALDRERGRYTTKTDSVFVLNSDRGRGTFNIAAIDDYGKADRTPARAFFKIIDNGLPRVEYLSVASARADLAPCGTCVLPSPPNSCSACTIPTFTNFKIRFTGTTRNGRITGFQWQSVLPGQTSPENFQPLGSDTLFLAAGRDTTAIGFQGDTLWTLRGDVVTVHYYSSRDTTKLIRPGNFSFRARVRDEAKRASLLSAAGGRRVVINFDPDTEIYRMPFNQCPNAPPGSNRTDLVRAGFITGVDNPNTGSWVDTLSSWIPFCDGDTLPNAAHVRFFVRGHDDRRDEPIHPPSLRDVGFSYRYLWHAPGLENLNMPFSTEYTPIDVVLPPMVPPPAGQTRNWHGGLKGWGDEAGVNGLCAFDYTFLAAAVDEHGKRDGTPDSLSFYVSGKPELDRLRVDDAVANPPDTLVVVFVPTCTTFLAGQGACPDSGVVFGLDTLKVLGAIDTVCTDPTPTCLFNPGANFFVFPFGGLGHDHPRDWNRPPFALSPSGRYTGNNVGRVRAWKFTFDCIPPCAGCTCDDIAIPGENDWRTDIPNNPARGSIDPPGQQLFDEIPRVRFTLDSLCTTPPIPGVPFCTSFRVRIAGEKLGLYRFTLQARDTDAIGQTCTEPSDLNPNAPAFTRSMSDQGRLTGVETRYIKWLQYSNVRPWTTRKAQESVWQARRKKVSR